MNLLATFIILSIANVIIQTVKSIATIKCGKTAAATINAIAYGLYTFVIIYTNCELNIWLKAGITAMTNFIGVFCVKFVEEKIQKDKLWKIDASFHKEISNTVHNILTEQDISHGFQYCGNYITFNCYCSTKAESAKVFDIVKEYGGKTFVTEQKA